MQPREGQSGYVQWLWAILSPAFGRLGRVITAIEIATKSCQPPSRVLP